MDTKEHLTQTLEHFRQQRSTKIQEIRSLDTIIRGLEQELGDPAPAVETSDSFVPLEPSAPVGVNGALPQPRADEFFSMTQTEAAKSYLKKVGRAISMDQLLDGMKRGGAHVGGADPKSTLYVSLMRNPNREFVRVSEGVVGLREFYPNLKSTKNGARRSRVKRTKKRKRRAASRGPVERKPVATKPEETVPSGTPAPAQAGPKIEKSEVHAAIQKILADGQLHARDAILKEVGRGLKCEIPRMSVYGCLRSKEFEEVDGQYRLKK